MLLQTKFHLPSARTTLVARPRLLEKLNRGRHNKLTLISAPAGFGKTTLVAAWLRTLEPEAAVAWLSLDKSDNDPAQFFAYLVGAIHKANGQVGRAAQAVMQSPERPTPNAIIVALINELSSQRRPFVLALDDYHLIDNETIHSALLFLIEQMPSQLHLILLTRTDPPLPLARLRVQRTINELRSHDLRFTANEVATFLNQIMGLRLTAGQVSALEARTEGWVASLQLAALSLQNERDADRFIAAFDGGHRHILDYLSEEALQHQPPDVRDFLLKSSILERLSAPLCDHLTGRNDSQALLTRLEQANLFLIPLDDHRQWYRYHHLFADLLRKLLRAAVGEEGMSRLHTQAARWFAEQEQMEDAVHHALAGHDYALAVDLIVATELAVENKGNAYTLMSWYKALPESLLRTRPKLTIRYAHKAMMNDDAEADKILNSPWLADLADPELLGEMAVLRGFLSLSRHEYARADQYAKEAYELLPATNDFYGGIFSVWGYVALEDGDLERAYVETKRAATWNQQAGRTAGAINNYATLAMICRDQGRSAEAEQVLRASLQLVEGSASPAEGDLYFQLAWSHLSQAAWQVAENYLHKALLIYQNAGEMRGEQRALVDLAFIKQVRLQYAAANALIQQASERTPPQKNIWGNVGLN